MKINEKIIKLRMAYNLTQGEFSKLLDTNQTTFSSWEIGRFMPRYRTLMKLMELGKKYDIEFSLDDILKHRKIKNKTEC
jgi:DNA-binding transcriptional regulator YiaG